MVEPGMTVGAAVLNPDAPDVELLKPGVALTTRIIDRLRQMRVQQIWVRHEFATDISPRVRSRLTAARVGVYSQLKRDFATQSSVTLSTGRVAQYRAVMSSLIEQLVDVRAAAGMTDELFVCRDGLCTHCANVAYLSVLIGMKLESYIIRERPRLTPQQACDMVSLGVGAMLHDIGKTVIQEQGDVGSSVRSVHEVHRGDDLPSGYEEHVTAGIEMLRNARVPASACQVALNHHQRFDGTGWPVQSGGDAEEEPRGLGGRSIHIFSRIVAAANVLDNLMAANDQTVPVAALHAFASPRFDGWFDPIIRRAVLRLIPPFAMGTAVTLNNGCEAAVIAPNMDDPCRPIVRPLISLRGQKAPVPINLAEQRDLRITRYLDADVAAYNFDLPPSAAAA